MNNMDVKLKTYYDNANELTKRLIDWCCIDNHEITEDYFNWLLKNRIEKYNKSAFKQNYSGEKIKLELKPIEDNDIDYLDKKIKELDGTLLVDIVFKFMRTHKIFI